MIVRRETMVLISSMGLLDIFRRKKKEAEEPEPEPPRPEPRAPPEPPEWLEIEQKVDYEGDSIRIWVRATNRSDEFLGSPVIRLLASPSLFEMDRDEVQQQELNAGESMEAVFHIKPLKELKRYEPKVEIEYFDFSLKEKVAYPMRAGEIVFEDEISIGRYPMDEDEFRVYTARLSPLEVETDELPLGGKLCHDGVMNVLKGMNVHIVEPVMVAPEIFRSIVRVGCRDHEGEVYAVEIQIIGNESVSRMLIRIWSRNGKHIMGLKNLLVRELSRMVPLSGRI